MAGKSDNISKSAHRLTRHIITFGRVLRRLGWEVGTTQVMDAMRALELIGLRRREDVYQALYSIFVTRHEQRELFDQVFRLFWRKPATLPDIMQIILPGLQASRVPSSRSLRVRQAMAEAEQRKQRIPAPENEKKPAVDLVLTYSPTELLRKKDFADFSTEEVIAAKQLLLDMRWPLARKKTRRRKPETNGRFLDLRRTIRRSMRQQGEMVKLSWHGFDSKPRNTVVLCDISGSMERYSRMLLHFMHTMTGGRRPVESFVFGTRLSRITRYLRQRDIDEAVSMVSDAVNDWAGGTRIGAAVKEFNYLWARRVLRSGSVVIIISDGWDRGDMQLLDCEMGRLSRSCNHLIWLNPLLGYSGYEPLTRGMHTAMPYIDEFLPVHNLASLEQLGTVLSNLL